MATRISQAELNAITMVAFPHINDDVRRVLSDLLGEVSRHRNKARKLGEYAAATRKVCKAYAYATLGAVMREHAVNGHVCRSIKSEIRKP